MGGTLVTILGQNLGMHGDNISVYLNDVRCNNVKVDRNFSRYGIFNCSINK